jgi:hypothetical protein
MKKFIYLLTFLIASGSILAQEKVTLSGYVKDGGNGESIIGANVYQQGTTNASTTNVYGFYSLTLPKGKNTVIFSYIGYKQVEKELDFDKNMSLDVELAENEKNTLEEVTISSEKENVNVKSMEMSVAKLDIKQISKIPALLGEVDVVRSIQMLPGVTSVGEGSSGFNVRGGNIDGNLILLDEAPVFNSSHLFGFFSVFNPDAVKDVKLYKGGIPAQYGGRISSLLDIRMKEGNNKKFEFNGGIGTIFSRFSVEGPIKKDKASFIIAGRRSYIDVLAKPIIKQKVPDLKDAKFYFYDLTGKVNWRINKKNQVFLSGYLGQDVFGAGFRFDWGNSTGTVRWNHIFGEKLFLNTTLYYSNYNYFLGFKNDNDKTSFDWKSNIINYSFKPEFTYYLNQNNTMHFGGQATYYNFKPGKAIITSAEGEKSETGLQTKYGLESAIYLDNEQKFGKRFSMQYGLRYSMFNYMGHGTAYYYYDTVPNNRKRLQEEKEFAKGKTIKQYGNLEPRLAVKYEVTDESSVKASYNRTAQYLHLVSNTAAATPLDIWTPVTNNILPQIADQVALGYFRNFKNNMYETSVEVYYKNMQNQLDYIDNSSLLLNKYLEADLLQGKGRAYGLELFIKKNKGKFTGWISYTLARTERKVNGLSKNEWYLSRYDRPHNLNVTASYEVNKRWTFGGNFVLMSGTPATYPNVKYEIQGYTVTDNTTEKRNNFRNTLYHRLDLSATWTPKKNDRRKRFKSNWVFSVYNVYNRKNAFTIFFRPNKDNPIQTEAVRYSVLGTFVPAVTYNFNF